VQNSENTVEIGGRLSNDLDLFYTVDEMRLLFDFGETYYKDLCGLVLRYFESESDSEKRTEAVAEITAFPMFNYLTEESGPRDMMYYICSMDNTFPEEGRQLFHGKKEQFDNAFN